jgi:hypothetical protein
VWHTTQSPIAARFAPCLSRAVSVSNSAGVSAALAVDVKCGCASEPNVTAKNAAHDNATSDAANLIDLFVIASPSMRPIQPSCIAQDYAIAFC